MSRTTATFSVSLPPEMAAELERVRKTEHRTRSEFVREALRRYIHDASVRAVYERSMNLPEEEPEDDERQVIERGRLELQTGKHTPFSQLRHELHGPRQQPRRKKS